MESTPEVLAIIPAGVVYAPATPRTFWDELWASRMPFGTGKSIVSYGGYALVLFGLGLWLGRR